MFATAEESREDIVAFYRRVWAHADATIAAADLDTVGRVVVVAAGARRRSRCTRSSCAWWPRPTGTPGTPTSCARRSTSRSATRPRNSNLPEDDYDWAAHYARVERAARARRTVEP